MWRTARPQEERFHTTVAITATMAKMNTPSRPSSGGTMNLSVPTRSAEMPGHSRYCVVLVISTLIAVILACFAAYAIARLEFPGKRVILAASLAIAMFPPISIVGPLYNMWRNLGLYDTWPGLIIPYMTFALPLSIYTLSAFFRQIPWELEEAAQIDGATPFQAFRKVIAPLATPGIVTTYIIVFIICWNDFIFAISLTSTTSAETVPAAIAQFPGASQFTQPIGDIAAAAVVVTVPVMILVLLFQRRIVSGLTAGAVKG